MSARERTKAQAIKLLSRASKDLDDAVKMLRQEGFAPETVLASSALRNTASAISRLADPPTEMTKDQIRATVTFNEVQAKGREVELRVKGYAPPLRKSQ